MHTSHKETAFAIIKQISRIKKSFTWGLYLFNISSFLSLNSAFPMLHPLQFVQESEGMLPVHWRHWCYFPFVANKRLGTKIWWFYFRFLSCEFHPLWTSDYIFTSSTGSSFSLGSELESNPTRNGVGQQTMSIMEEGRTGMKVCCQEKGYSRATTAWEQLERVLKEKGSDISLYTLGVGEPLSNIASFKK